MGIISSYLALISHFLTNDVAFFSRDCFLRVFWSRGELISAVGCKDSLMSPNFLLSSFCNLKMCKLTNAVGKLVICVILPLASVAWSLTSVDFWGKEGVSKDTALITIVCDSASETNNIPIPIPLFPSLVHMIVVNVTFNSFIIHYAQAADNLRVFAALLSLWDAKVYYLSRLVSLSRVVTSAVSRSGLLQESRPNQHNGESM